MLHIEGLKLIEKIQFDKSQTEKMRYFLACTENPGWLRRLTDFPSTFVPACGKSMLVFMEIFGYLASALIGISLGLIGSGGSILTVPVLVYLFRIEPSLATAYSLFIVGTTALVGGVQSSLRQLVDGRTALIFAIPSFIAVYLTRRWLVPLIPAQMHLTAEVALSKNLAIMLFFALMMLMTAISMIRNRGIEPADPMPHRARYPMIVLEGLVVGILTGLVGAGGGFLIIPALVLFAGLPMKKAVGTSLLIIAAKSLIGFLGDVRSGQRIDYAFLLLVSAIAVGGIFLGLYLSRFMDGRKLKAAFGWFVLAMSVYILLKEFFAENNLHV